MTGKFQGGVNPFTRGCCGNMEFVLCSPITPRWKMVCVSIRSVQNVLPLTWLTIAFTDSLQCQICWEARKETARPCTASVPKTRVPQNVPCKSRGQWNPRKNAPREGRTMLQRSILCCWWLFYDDVELTKQILRAQQKGKCLRSSTWSNRNVPPLFVMSPQIIPYGQVRNLF